MTTHFEQILESLYANTKRELPKTPPEPPRGKLTVLIQHDDEELMLGIGDQDCLQWLYRVKNRKLGWREVSGEVESFHGQIGEWPEELLFLLAKVTKE